MKRMLIILLALVLVGTACGGGDDEGTDETTLATTSTTEPETTSSRATTSTTRAVDPSDAWLFNGVALDGSDQPSADGELLIAKYSNAPKGRPQLGIERADLLMEVVVEGGVARILAVFQSDVPETIGPLRSAREVDPKLLEPFNAFFASSGGQPAVLRDIEEVAANVGDGRVPGYFRQSGRTAPYNLFLNTDELFDEAELEAPTDWSISFDDETPEGEQALSVEVDISTFHTTNYRFSASDAGYLRFNGEEPHVTVDDEQLVASNIVVLFIEQLSTGRVDGSGAPVPDFEVLGTGDALVFRNGVAVQATWERGRSEDFFRLFDEAGDEIPLTPGQTWFEMVPIGRPVNWQ